LVYFKKYDKKISREKRENIYSTTQKYFKLLSIRKIKDGKNV